MKRGLNFHKTLKGLSTPKWDPWDLQIPRMGWSGRGLSVCCQSGLSGHLCTHRPLTFRPRNQGEAGPHPGPDPRLPSEGPGAVSGALQEELENSDRCPQGCHRLRPPGGRFLGSFQSLKAGMTLHSFYSEQKCLCVRSGASPWGNRGECNTSCLPGVCMERKARDPQCYGTAQGEQSARVAVDARESMQRWQTAFADLQGQRKWLLKRPRKGRGG